nr:hypothetical protein [Micromonospora sp. DSM 115978]
MADPPTEAPVRPDSLAPEAIALTRLIGQPLTPWQEDVLARILTLRSPGEWQASGVVDEVPEPVLQTRALAGPVLLDEQYIM